MCVFRVSALLSEELKGALTDPVTFRTLSCEPERPQPPKLMNKTKTALMLKWNVSCPALHSPGGSGGGGGGSGGGGIYL